ncbi:ABC transporter permease [Nocardioides aromaticivorans]|uniref:ABC transporter permease n=1 Tax=Nocardioides aromaticivorans TaxID=200618 RepID=A0ABX7PH84_9ACTN|nr:ABC transporter permease subunit [Nocardioides aromaticivorans]QSR25323.1 ABC transporter permease [Nocardioides aromaticivorans]
MSRAIGRSLLNALVTVLVVLALWQAVVSFAGVSPYIAKGPLDVFRFLFVDEAGAAPGRLAADHRDALRPLTTQTLRDAVLGFGVGMAIAVALAVAFSLSKTVEAGVLPLALLLRSVPLVSISPVIILITGRGTTASVAVIGSIVVLFPALASALFGLGRASRESLDLVHVYGGGNATALRKVAIPGALPSLFAAARVSVPGAVTGALLAEWLSTGKGIGGSIQKFSAAAKFDDLWASVAIITAITLLLYNLVQLLENVVLARMGMSQQQP